MTYIEHMTFSLRIGTMFLKASGCAFVHAFIPSYCKDTTSKTVKEIMSMLRENGCDRKIE